MLPSSVPVSGLPSGPLTPPAPAATLTQHSTAAPSHPTLRWCPRHWKSRNGRWDAPAQFPAIKSADGPACPLVVCFLPPATTGPSPRLSPPPTSLRRWLGRERGYPSVLTKPGLPLLSAPHPRTLSRHHLGHKNRSRSFPLPSPGSAPAPARALRGHCRPTEATSI